MVMPFVVVVVVVDVSVEVGLVTITSTIHEIRIIASNSDNVQYVCMLLSICKLHKNLPVVSSVVPFVAALVVSVYLTQIAAATGFSLGVFTKVVLFPSGSFLVVSVSFEAFLVFAVF